MTGTANARKGNGVPIPFLLLLSVFTIVFTAFIAFTVFTCVLTAFAVLQFDAGPQGPGPRGPVTVSRDALIGAGNPLEREMPISPFLVVVVVDEN